LIFATNGIEKSNTATFDCQIWEFHCEETGIFYNKDIVFNDQTWWFNIEIQSMKKPSEKGIEPLKLRETLRGNQRHI